MIILIFPTTRSAVVIGRFMLLLSPSDHKYAGFVRYYVILMKRRAHSCVVYVGWHDAYFKCPVINKCAQVCVVKPTRGFFCCRRQFKPRGQKFEGNTVHFNASAPETVNLSHDDNKQVIQVQVN